MSSRKDHQYPERLYHYTSLASLALILKNRTLRHMPLTGMDDPQENQTMDVENLGKFFFASCWTDEKKESIPMWNIYASLESGVRIDLPPMPFKHYEYTAAQIADIFSAGNVHDETSNGIIKSFLPIEDLRNGLVCWDSLTGQHVLRKVEYTDETEKIYPKIVNIQGNQLHMALNRIGTYKNTYWEFQHEWRYLLNIIPLRIIGASNEDLEKEFEQIPSKIIQGQLAPACNYYDLRLDDNALAGIGITPSPKMSEGNRVLLSSLLEKYGLLANLKHSQLEGAL